MSSDDAALVEAGAVQGARRDVGFRSGTDMGG